MSTGTEYYLHLSRTGIEGSPELCRGPFGRELLGSHLDLFELPLLIVFIGVIGQQVTLLMCFNLLNLPHFSLLRCYVKMSLLFLRLSCTSLMSLADMAE